MSERDAINGTVPLGQGRLVHTRYGDMLVQGFQDLISRSLADYGEWAQNEIDVFARFIKVGSVVLDIGAYLGSHSRAFSKISGAAGTVIAFEPNPRSFSLLRENIGLSPFQNIKAMETALGDFDSLLPLQTPAEENGGASYLSKKPIDSTEAIPVRVQRLDDLNFDFSDGLSFIKIDVEGFESPVLSGAEKTIARHQPVIYAEANTLSASYRILEWAGRQNYLVFGLAVKAFNPANFNSATENIFGAALECGVLCIHRDRLASYDATIAELGLQEIRDLDDLAATLYLAPQYRGLISDRQRSLRSIGIYEEVQLSSTQTSSEQILNELSGVRDQLTTAEKALAETRELAIDRMARIDALQTALTQAQELEFDRMARIDALQTALTQAQELAFDRMARIDALQTALTQAQELAFDRMAYIEKFHQSLLGRTAIK
ncbi:MAG: FkbM family methyltransferase, partial [Pseudomonadota bacterium]